MSELEFKYPSEWTEDFASYRKHRGQIVERIRHLMENYNDYLVSLEKQRTKLNKEFFSGAKLYDAIKEE
jgi:hypothetical protein